MSNCFSTICWKDCPLSFELPLLLYQGSVQFNLVAQSCPTLCDPMDCSTPGFLVHHQLPEPAQTHVHHVGNAIQPSHPLSSPSPSAFSLSQHQGLFQRVSSWYQVAKVLELQLQHQPFHLQQCYSTFLPVSLQRHQWRCKDVLLCFLNDAQNKRKRLKEASWVHWDLWTSFLFPL